MALAAERGDDLDAAFATLAASRPTAVNLRWALEAMRDEPTRGRAERIHADEVERCRTMGAHAVELFPEGARVLTHCNAGALATGGLGTALAPVYVAAGRGQDVHVLATETRPLLQGSRLTAWELTRAGIPVTLITDSAAASRMRAREVDLCIVGADRVVANGDVANKVGTYALAVLARYHGIPFYVAMPTSTIDPSLASGDQITIEQRDPREVSTLGDRRITVESASIGNAAFDVTPADLVTAFITDRGILRPPYHFK